MKIYTHQYTCHHIKLLKQLPLKENKLPPLFKNVIDLALKININLERCYSLDKGLFFIYAFDYQLTYLKSKYI